MHRRTIGIIAALVITTTIFLHQSIDFPDVAPVSGYTAVHDANRGKERSVCSLIGELRVTAYCNEDYAHICNDGTSQTNASGLPHTPGVIVASNEIPLFTTIYIEGVGYRIVGDRGASDVDVLMDSHEDALRFGVKVLRVWVVK